MREERADLRSQVYVLEQEKKSLELFVSSQKAQETALKAHIKHLQDEIENHESIVRYSKCTFIFKLIHFSTHPGWC